jgi:formylglycine-generating enzyme
MTTIQRLFLLTTVAGVTLAACASQPDDTDLAANSPTMAGEGGHGGSASQGGATGQGGATAQGGGAGQGGLAGQGGAGGYAGEGGGAGQGGSVAQGGSSGAPTGGSSGQGGASGTSSSGGASGGAAAGNGGATSGAGGGQGSECPKGNATAMVKLSSPTGVAYCIDRAEVTQAQYAAFLEAKNGDVSGQDSFCNSSNFTFEPQITEGDDFKCPAGRWDPKGKANWPVECLDLCDARAFCKWVGKRLCGRIGGGLETEPSKLNAPERSQWYNACSQGGKLPYAYGTEYDDANCVEYGPLEDSPGCHAKEQPFSEILNLSGNRAELEDMDFPPGTTVPARAVKSFSHPYACDAIGGASYGVDVSFRCCADL